MITNIFQKKSKNKKKFPEPIIEIDFREKKSLVPAELIGMNQQIKFLELKIGDYIVNNTIIERKTIIDLTESIKNDRIFRQLKNMQTCKNKLLIIEGNIYSQQKINPNAIKGFILSTVLNKKIPIIFTNNSKETARYLSLLNQQRKKPHQINKTKIPKTKEEIQNHILQSFEGIGPKTSKLLLNKFHTLKEIFNAKEEELFPILHKKTYKFLNYLTE